MNRFLFLLLGMMVVAIVPWGSRSPDLKVGSKKFTESVILGELVAGLARSPDCNPLHFQELGGTRLVFNALVNGEIDVYPEYTGTIIQEILAAEDIRTSEHLTQALANVGVAISPPLGFNNTYAIGMLKPRAQELGIDAISDLGRYPQLKFGVTSEFLERGDGWRALTAFYGLSFPNVRGLDHDIAYRQLTAGTIDALDVYATDAKIQSLDLKILRDDRQFFQRYDAVLLYRSQLNHTRPEFVAALQQLAGKIDESTMSSLNLAVEEGSPEKIVASQWLQEQLGIEDSQEKVESTFSSILQRTLEHLDLVRKSLIPAILVGIPLGIIADRFKGLGQVILGTVGIFQTIPALALLVLVMPLVALLGARTIGGGSLSAILALFLYSLLPIVRNTYAGFQGISPQYRESARALGLSPWYRLLHIELPLATRSILAGIKTAAVMNVGFAALGALIGAGGYGQPILTGIRLNRLDLILQGAVPAALLALVVQFLFDLLGRWVIPRGLRLKPSE